MTKDKTNKKSEALTYEEQLRDLYNSKKFEEALRLVLDEEQKQPKDPKILAAKATLFGILDKYEESIDAANEALKLNFILQKTSLLSNIKKIQPQKILPAQARARWEGMCG